MGIRGTALKWFESYLTNRSQFVELNGTKSKIFFIRILVMQGSILGPILLICYINDLWKTTNLLTLMFADDTLSFKSGKKLRPIYYRNEQ